MDTIIQDLRYALRTMAKKPGFTAIAVITLALGIGANTAIFSVVDSVLLRPLPYSTPDRLIWAYGKFPLADTAGVTGPDFRDYRVGNQTFDQFAALLGHEAMSNISGGDKPELVPSKAVSWNFFEALGIHPLYGRGFLPSDEQENLPQVVILGNGIWKRDFGSDPSVIGKRISVEGATETIVGVLPVDLPMISAADLWHPLPMLNRGMNYRIGHSLFVIGRMKPGVTVGQASGDLDTVAANLAAQYPDTNKGWSLHVIPLSEKIVGDVRSPLILLLGAVGLLLLIACANVANLLLARASARRKEIAIRAAMGAGQWRIIRQMLTESTLLAGIGGALGVLIAVWGVSALRFLAPADLPRLNDINVNAPALLFTLGISLAAGILFGLAPALQLSKHSFDFALKEGGKGTASTMRHRLGSVLVIAEVALSLCLLLGGGLLLKSFWQLVHVDPGFKPQHVLTARLNLPSPKYAGSGQQAAFVSQLEQSTLAVPGVEALGTISELPLGGGGGDNPFTVEGKSYPPNGFDDADFRQVASNYISAMRIPLLAGRWFDDRDTPQSNPAIVVNDAFAKRYFNGLDALGKRLQVEGDPLKTREIIGIIGTVSHYALGESPRPEMYVPIAQYPYGNMTIVMRASGDPNILASSLRDAVAALDKDQAISDVRSMEDVIGASVAQPRFSAQLLGLFATLALVLAAVGLYGLVAYTVTQRTHEIGIRMALGAAPADIRRMVLARGMRLALAGAAIGVLTALGLARLLTGLLFGVRATDPTTLIGVTSLLTIVALAASYLPARRAMRVDPLVALRYE